MRHQRPRRQLSRRSPPPPDRLRLLPLPGRRPGHLWRLVPPGPFDLPLLRPRRNRALLLRVVAAGVLRLHRRLQGGAGGGDGRGRHLEGRRRRWAAVGAKAKVASLTCSRSGSLVRAVVASRRGGSARAGRLRT
ncbi:hypothetical protein MUK42_07209 [Musa troglodytarum]|nr:hypothetical protein MUK42_07209 [Musa troglodytarum]